MDQLTPSIISDVILDKLSLRDIRALRSTNRQYFNIPISRVFITAIWNDPVGAVDQMYGYLDTRDPTKTIAFWNMDDLLINSQPIKYAIYPKIDIIDYIRKHGVIPLGNYHDDEYIEVSQLAEPIAIFESVGINSMIELPIPVWRLVRKMELPDATVYEYRITNKDKILDYYHIDKSQFTDIYCNILRKQMLGLDYNYLFLFVNRRTKNYAIYRFSSDGYSGVTGGNMSEQDEPPIPLQFAPYIIKNINNLDIYDLNEILSKYYI